jgi:hypothetical protein
MRGAEASSIAKMKKAPPARDAFAFWVLRQISCATGRWQGALWPDRW